MSDVLMKPKVGTPERTVMAVDWQYYVDPRMCAVVLLLAAWTMCQWSIGIVITCLNRTVDENRRLGGYEFSAHLSGRGVDIRSRTFTVTQITQIIEYLETTWGDFIYVKYHNSGSGHHIHINIRYGYKRGRYGRPRAA